LFAKIVIQTISTEALGIRFSSRSACLCQFFIIIRSVVLMVRIINGPAAHTHITRSIQNELRWASMSGLGKFKYQNWTNLPRDDPTPTIEARRESNTGHRLEDTTASAL
jgi:hypothetical protein